MTRFALILAVAALSTPALAQQAPKPPESYTLTLAPQEVEAVFNTIAEKPYKDVAPLLAKIRDQIAQQQAKAASPPQEK